jgi:energy-coupling factor transporter ATP-binding protein EcfA2
MKFIKSKNIFTALASFTTGIHHSNNNFFYNKFSAEAQQKDDSNKKQKLYDMLKSIYPSDYVHGILSLHAYEKQHEKDSPKFKDSKFEEKYKELIKDWKIVDTYPPDSSEQKGFYAALYYNEKDNQFILSYKGTDEKNDLYIDVKGILCNEITTYHEKVDKVAKSAMLKANEKNAHLSITGHSLGGWLAQQSLYYIEVGAKEDDETPKKKAKAVTFDNPGSAELLKEKYKCNLPKENYNPKEKMYNLNMVTYLAAPNIINILNKHLGDVYTVDPNKSYDNNGMLNIDTHRLENILAHFEDSKIHEKRAKVSNWPKFSNENKETLKSITEPNVFIDFIKNPFKIGTIVNNTLKIGSELYEKTSRLSDKLKENKKEYEFDIKYLTGYNIEKEHEKYLYKGKEKIYEHLKLISKFDENKYVTNSFIKGIKDIKKLFKVEFDPGGDKIKINEESFKRGLTIDKLKDLAYGLIDDLENKESVGLLSGNIETSANHDKVEEFIGNLYFNEGKSIKEIKESYLHPKKNLSNISKYFRGVDKGFESEKHDDWDKNIEMFVSTNIIKSLIEGNHEINKKISEANKNEKENIIVIGNTGAGKSTFVNYMTGAELKIIDGVIKLNYEISEEDANLKERPKIGHTKESLTAVPNYYEYNDSVYWDCPGFGDNRTEEQDILNALYIKKLFNELKKVKIIYVVNYTKEIDGKKIDDFKSFFDMFDDAESLKNKLLTVVTFYEEEKEKFKDIIDYQKNHFKKIFSGDSKVFDLLLSNCVLMPSPKFLGIKEPCALDYNEYIKEYSEKIDSSIRGLKKSKEKIKIKKIPIKGITKDKFKEYSDRFKKIVTEYSKKVIKQYEDELLKKENAKVKFKEILDLVEYTEKTGKSFEEFYELLKKTVSNADDFRKLKLSLEMLETLNHLSGNNDYKVDYDKYLKFKSIEKIKTLAKKCDTYSEENTIKKLQNYWIEKNKDKSTYFIDTECAQKDGEPYVLKGGQVKLSKVNKELENCIEKTKYSPTTQNDVHILSYDKFLFDCDIDLRKYGNVSIAAPYWDIDKKVTVDLSGMSHSHNPKASTGQHGKSGLPGNPGKNFLGVFHDINKGSNLSNLTINVRGGDGQDGQEGGNGNNAKKNNFVINLFFNIITLGSIDGDSGCSGNSGGEGGDSGKNGSAEIYRGFTDKNTYEGYRLVKEDGKNGNSGKAGIGGRGANEGLFSSRKDGSEGSDDFNTYGKQSAKPHEKLISKEDIEHFYSYPDIKNFVERFLYGKIPGFDDYEKNIGLSVLGDSIPQDDGVY